MGKLNRAQKLPRQGLILVLCSHRLNQEALRRGRTQKKRRFGLFWSSGGFRDIPLGCGERWGSGTSLQRSSKSPLLLSKAAKEGLWGRKGGDCLQAGPNPFANPDQLLSYLLETQDCTKVQTSEQLISP